MSKIVMGNDELTSKAFGKDVIAKFKECIADRIFLFIEEDDKLFSQYLDMISAKGRETVNSELGKLINEEFGLENMIDQNGDKIKAAPKSRLIKTVYTKHE